MPAELKNINQILKDGSEDRFLVQDFSCIIYDSEIISLVGTSGSGKTALLRMLGCLDNASSGSYLLNGRQATLLPESGLAKIRRDYIGFIGFYPEFLEEMTVAETLSLPLYKLSKKERQQAVVEGLEKIGLVRKMKSPIHKLKLLERMQISALRAFMKQPVLVVADEPGVQLHSDEALQLFDTLVQVRQDYGGSLIFSTYDPAHLKRAHRLIYMRNGRLVKIVSTA